MSGCCDSNAQGGQQRGKQINAQHQPPTKMDNGPRWFENGENDKAQNGNAASKTGEDGTRQLGKRGKTQAGQHHETKQRRKRELATGGGEPPLRLKVARGKFQMGHLP